MDGIKINRSVKIYAILICFFAGALNLSAQPDSEMAQAYYKKAKTAYLAKNYTEAQKHIYKSASYNISKGEEAVTYLMVKIAYAQKRYRIASKDIDKYFKLTDLKTSGNLDNLKINLPGSTVEASAITNFASARAN